LIHRHAGVFPRRCILVHCGVYDLFIAGCLGPLSERAFPLPLEELQLLLLGSERIYSGLGAVHCTRRLPRSRIYGCPTACLKTESGRRIFLVHIFFCCY
jgi:hypothetical protein